MAEDLMSTQTGGEGNTIQAQPKEQATPEQFDAKLPSVPPIGTQPPPSVPSEEELQGQAPINLPPQETPTASNLMEQQVASQQETAPQVIQPTEEEMLGLINVKEPDGFSDNANDIAQQIEVPTNPDVKTTAEVKSDIDNEVKYINGIPVNKNPVQIEQPETITLPTVDILKPDNEVKSINGVPVNNDAVPQNVLNVNKEYKGTGIELDRTGKINIIKEKPKTEKPTTKSNGLYKLSTHPEATYKKENNKWYIDAKGTGKFMPLISGNVPERTRFLEKNAESFKKQEPKEDGMYAFEGRPNAVYRKTKGEWYIDANGSGNWSQITENKEARTKILEEKARPYSQMDEANKIIKSAFGILGGEAPEDLITAKGDAVVTSGLNFNSMLRSNMGNNLEKYNQDGTLNFNYNPELADLAPQVRNIIEKKPEIKKTKTVLDAFSNTEIGRAYDPLSVVKRMKEYDNTIVEKNLNDAKAFAEKDVNIVYGNKLTHQQKEILRGYQDEINLVLDSKSMGNELKSGTIAKTISEAKTFFDDAKAINQKINNAATEGKSLDRVLLDEKKSSYNQTINSGQQTEFADMAMNIFETNTKIADYIQTKVDDGIMRWDRANGKFIFAETASPQEITYAQNKIYALVSEYNQLKEKRFAEVNEEISDLKQQKNDYNANKAALRNILNSEQKGSDKYNIALKKLDDYQKRIDFLDRKINDKEMTKNGVFLTEPKKLAASTAGNATGMAKNIFSSLPNSFSPKQKFDMFYSQLLASNDKLAKDNGIDTDKMTNISMRVRDMLDWGGSFSLSDAETEYLKNKTLLHQLSPVYYNNDTGVTQSSAGFFDSFMTSFYQTLFPKTAKAKGIVLQTETAGAIKNAINEAGFSDNDFVDDKLIEKLEERSTVSLMSGEKWGGFTGSSAGIVAALIGTKNIGAGLLRLGRAATRVNSIVNAAKNTSRAATALSIYEESLKATKLGKYLVPAVKSGIEFESAGTVFGSTRDELDFMTGLAGGVASEALSGVFSRLGSSKGFEYVKKVFGDKTNLAVEAIKKVGHFGVRGTVETGQEAVETLTQIYNDKNRESGFFDAVKEQFPNLDSVQEFVISSFIMGGFFGLTESTKAKDAYDSMPENKKKEVNSILASMKTDEDEAIGHVEDYADEVERVEKIKEEVNNTKEKKAPEEEKSTEETTEETTEAKKEEKAPKENDLGLIFDVGSIEDVSSEPITSDAPTIEQTGESFDLTNTEENDKENIEGIPSEERIGEEPIQAEPVAETSKEEVSPSGVVQEEQVEGKTEAPAETKIEATEAEVEAPIGKSEEKITETTNPFSDIKSVDKHPVRSSKRKQAIADFDAKHGEGSYKRVSKIDANFDKIIKKFEENELITKKC